MVSIRLLGCEALHTWTGASILEYTTRNEKS